MNEIRRRRTLNKYIDSDGTELPLDYHYYSVGAEKEELCIFCEDYHMMNNVYIWDPVEEKVSKDLGIYSCDQCNTHVEAMLHRVYNMEITGKETLDLGEDIGQRKVSTKNSLKLGEFVDSLKFDEDIYKYYVHLNPNKDQYVDNNQCNKCFICNSDAHGHPIMAYKTWPTAWVPVMHEERFISGGKVFICNDDLLSISTQFIGIKDLQDLYTHFILLKKIGVKVCPNCRATYYIDNDESNYRLKHEENRFVCPECALENLDRLNEDHWLYDHNIIKRYHPPERHYEVMCTFCRESIMIDRFIDIEYLEEKYLDDKENIYCDKCLKAGLKPFVSAPLTFRYKSNVYIHLTKHDGSWNYDILRIDRITREIEIVLRAKTDLSDITEVVTIAFNETELLFDGKQLELW